MRFGQVLSTASRLVGSSLNVVPQFEELSSLRTTYEMNKMLSNLCERMRSNGQEFDPASKLEPRRMHDSRSQILVPIASDPEARIRYISHSGAVRFGKLLEDMDMFSAWLGFLHNFGSVEAMEEEKPIRRAMVTACVDKIDLQRNILSSERDMVLDGHIGYVGKTSVETIMRLFQEDGKGSMQQLLQAKFVMVSLDPLETKKTVPVHPMSRPSVEEAVIFNAGVMAFKDRKQADQYSLFLRPPVPEEIQLLHETFLNSLGKDEHTYGQRPTRSGDIYMMDTQLQTTKICFPENKNIYGKIFGGFLMREAFELASATSKFFCKKPTEVFAVDDIVFRRPVETGDTLIFTAWVTYTLQNCMQVRVEARVRNYDKEQTSNTFHFSFRTRDDSPVSAVVPNKYNEGMMMLNGRRHLLKSMAANLI
uniref:HotDog ACOT-type domain-containing protein n=1 Tax=Panagrolaimus sp. JU765 TaxID=591449 RepID=A0AC34R6U7_9BILA